MGKPYSTSTSIGCPSIPRGEKCRPTVQSQGVNPVLARGCLDGNVNGVPSPGRGSEDFSSRCSEGAVPEVPHKQLVENHLVHTLQTLLTPTWLVCPVHMVAASPLLRQEMEEGWCTRTFHRAGVLLKEISPASVISHFPFSFMLIMINQTFSLHYSFSESETLSLSLL